MHSSLFAPLPGAASDHYDSSFNSYFQRTLDRLRVAMPEGTAQLAREGCELNFSQGDITAAWCPEMGYLNEMLDRASVGATSAAAQYALCAATLGCACDITLSTRDGDVLYFKGYRLRSGDRTRVRFDGEVLLVDTNEQRHTFLCSGNTWHRRQTPADASLRCTLGRVLLLAGDFIDPGLRIPIDDELSHQAFEHAVTSTAEALTTIADVSAEYRGWCDRVLRQVQLVGCKKDNVSTSRSALQRPGIVVMSFPADVVMLMEALVHECTHQYFYLMESIAPIKRDTTDEKLYFSSIVERQRPIEKVLFAYHATANILLSLSLITKRCPRLFAEALDDVKASARDLLSADSGAPAATAALKELAETLKDPQLVEAADSFASAMIRVFAATSKFAAGSVGAARFAGEDLAAFFGGPAAGDSVRIDEKIERIDAVIANKSASLVGAVGVFAAQLKREIAELEAQKAALDRLRTDYGQNPATARGSGFGFDTRLLGGDLPGFSVDDLEVMSDLRKEMAEFRRIENINPVDNLQEQLGEFVKSFESEIQDGVIETSRQAAESIGEVGDALGDKILGKSKELSVFAEEAARNMEGAFADFLFDPFDGGVKGMLKGFVDVLRRMIAEATAAKIFEKLFGSGSSASGSSGALSGLGQIFSAFIGGSGGGSVPSYAQGTNYVPNDGLAYLHRGEQVVPAGMGGSVNITTHIDARGATKDSIPQLMAAQRQRDEKLKADILSGIQSGRYPVTK